jgi:ribosomal protein L22
MSPESPETPDRAGTPDADAPRSEETEAAVESEETRGASPADAPSRPHGDELSEAVDEVAAPDGPEAEASADDEEPEPAAETDDEAPEADSDDEAPEAESDDDELEADADDEEPEADASEADAPKRRRRPGRRRSEEAEADDTPALPAPTRRRAQRDPNEPAPVVRAQAKYVRSSARKARLVCDHIRGKSVDEARAILAVTPRAIARDWSKLLESAVANAEHNHELVGEDLYVKAVHADEGPTIKRFRPRAMGRATRIRKRTSHLTILLTPKD